ncbi:putative RING-H2 finger protein ATL21A [Impatiens glandulifera]|uniref:putative RING-H2 finger protein ATL21A n=1 Tax=Impatiens glandulifera TaxID=253017 RepID=UPI001FB0FA0C|nr:putative RING-H2 finger protein ATL21A [Impatiens glandulifera]
MAFFNLFNSLFVFNIIILILPIYAKESCKSSNCTNDNLQIRFPFILKGQQDQSCGYPGFNLTCDSQGLPSIDLPFSGRFLVQNISYNQQVIELYDTDNCLPKRLIGLNLSGSPFIGTYYYYREYSLLSCPFGFNSSLSYTVNCLSNSTNTVIVVKEGYATPYFFPNCKKMVAFNVPFPGGDYNFIKSFDYNFDYLWLTWNNPYCRYCEMDGGVCGPTSTVGQDFECIVIYPKPASHAGNIINMNMKVKKILISFGITAIVVIVVFACYKFYKEVNSQNITNPVNISLSSTTRGGLDDSTIQSYPIVIIGESGLSPGLNNKICPICLSEFLAKETVRFIPDCTHCFHSECIDEWLHLNPSCPVCRILPTHVHSSFGTNVQ